MKQVILSIEHSSVQASLCARLLHSVYGSLQNRFLLYPRRTFVKRALGLATIAMAILLWGPLGLIPAFLKNRVPHILLASFITWSGITIDPTNYLALYKACQRGEVMGCESNYQPTKKDVSNEK